MRHNFVPLVLKKIISRHIFISKCDTISKASICNYVARNNFIYLCIFLKSATQLQPAIQCCEIRRFKGFRYFVSNSNFKRLNSELAILNSMLLIHWVSNSPNSSTTLKQKFAIVSSVLIADSRSENKPLIAHQRLLKNRTHESVSNKAEQPTTLTIMKLDKK